MPLTIHSLWPFLARRHVIGSAPYFLYVVFLRNTIGGVSRLRRDAIATCLTSEGGCSLDAGGSFLRRERSKKSGRKRGTKALMEKAEGTVLNTWHNTAHNAVHNTVYNTAPTIAPKPVVQLLFCDWKGGECWGAKANITSWLERRKLSRSVSQRKSEWKWQRKWQWKSLRNAGESAQKCRCFFGSKPAPPTLWKAGVG